MRLRVQPGARRVGIDGEEGGRLRIRVQAPPVEGAANTAVLRFLAKEVFHMAPSRLRLLKGSTSREKEVLVTGIELATVLGALEGHLPQRPGAGM